MNIYSDVAMGGPMSYAEEGSDMMFSMFPLVEKLYNVQIDSDIEEELRALGQSRADALLSGDFYMKHVKEKSGVELYECNEKDLYTLKGVTTVKANVSEVIDALNSTTSDSFRDVMQNIFGSLFLDGVVLHSAANKKSEEETLCVKWMALQSTHALLPHRDYLFLQYSDCFERYIDHGSLYSSADSEAPRSWVGAHIWESIELNGCPVLPESQNVNRSNFRRCGFTVEETHDEDVVRISFFLSETLRNRDAIKGSTKKWMQKMVCSISNLASMVVSNRLGEQQCVDKTKFTKDSKCCALCLTKFSMMRRRHHCRFCASSICSKCSVLQQIHQGRRSVRSVRCCKQCLETPSGRKSASSGKNSGTTAKEDSPTHPNPTPSQVSASSSQNISSGQIASGPHSQHIMPPVVNIPRHVDPNLAAEFYQQKIQVDHSNEPVRAPPSKTFQASVARSQNVVKERASLDPQMSAKAKQDIQFRKSMDPTYSKPMHNSFSKSKPSKPNDMIMLPLNNEKAIKNPEPGKSSNDMILLDIAGPKKTIARDSKKVKPQTDMIFLSPSDSQNSNSSGAKVIKAADSPKKPAKKVEKFTKPASHIPESDKYKDFTIATSDLEGDPIDEDAIEMSNAICENTPFNYALSYASRQPWPKAPVPKNESARAAKVKTLRIADSQKAFQEMCELAANTMSCPIAAICFVEESNGFLLSKVGLENQEISRDILFEAHTIMSNKPTIILNTQEDVRFVKNPLVTETPKIRFYAGFPLITSDGFVIGSLSVADLSTRDHVPGDKVFMLNNLADLIVRGIEKTTMDDFSIEDGHENMQFGSVFPDKQPEEEVNVQHTMEELLKAAYVTQCQVRMQQVSPIKK